MFFPIDKFRCNSAMDDLLFRRAKNPKKHPIPCRVRTQGSGGSRPCLTSSPKGSQFPRPVLKCRARRRGQTRPCIVVEVAKKIASRKLLLWLAMRRDASFMRLPPLCGWAKKGGRSRIPLYPFNCRVFDLELHSCRQLFNQRRCDWLSASHQQRV